MLNSIAIDPERLGPIVVRQTPIRQTNRAGEELFTDPKGDAETGEVVQGRRAIFMGEAIIPGMVQGFSVIPGAVRFRVLDSDPELPTGSIVRLSAGQLTAWFNAENRQAGTLANGHVTLACSAADIRLSDENPSMTGGLPVRFDEDGFLLLSVEETRRETFSCTVMLPAAMYNRQGTAVVEVTAHPESAVGRQIRFVDLTAEWKNPTIRELRARYGPRPEISLRAGAVEVLEPVYATSNGRSRRSQATPEPTPEVTE